MRTTTLLAAVLFLAGCEANNAIKPASKIKIGMTEQQAIATAGSPTGTHEPDQYFCQKPRGVRVLVYSDTETFLRLMKFTHASMVFCVDGRGVIIDQQYIER